MKEIVDPLLQWYRKQKRVLPWRESKDAYAIWVSEIMLQQTRVEAVKPYFQRFTEALPDAQALSEAKEDFLLKLWEGLGYYNRVKNMQKAAKVIVEEYGGSFPKDYEKLLALPGIGSYTAGAIASIAFDLPYVAVDGNVLRVVTRLLADDREINKESVRKDLSNWVKEILPHQSAGDFNQGMMELGAMICLPNGMPLCEQCPLRIYCKAFEENKVLDFPVKAEKKQRRLEDRNVYFMVYEDKIAINKREKKGLLSSLWELPNHLIADETSIFQQLSDWGIEEARMSHLGDTRHIFTHIQWNMECYAIEVYKIGKTNFQWVTSEMIESQYSLPSAFKQCYQWGMEDKRKRDNEKKEKAEG